MSAAPNLYPVDVVVDRLRDRGCNPKASRAGQWNAKCPVTDGHKNGDKNPSLSVGTGPDGKALVFCQKGCRVPDIAHALDLRLVDLFPDTPSATIGDGKRIVATYDYYDADGTLVFQVVRYRPKTFKQRKPDGIGWVWTITSIPERPLYMLPQVTKAIAEGKRIWMTEGEKDAESLQWEIDGAATCNSGGAGNWRDEYARQLQGAKRITIVQDNDITGVNHAKTFAAKLILAGFQDVEIVAPPSPFKDTAEALGAGRTVDQFVNIWDAAMDMAYLTIDTPTDDTDADEMPDEPVEDDWSPHALDTIARQIIDGTFLPTMPTVLEVANALPLFYAERINSLFGESGGGKTWVALKAAAETVALGRRVLFIDYEDNPNGIAERLVILGVTLEQMRLIDYRNPTTSISTGLETLDDLATTYSLVIIDSTGEAMAAGGVNSNDDGEVAQWFAIAKRLIRLSGRPCIIVLDHVPKNQEGTHLFGIGSQRKRAAVTGASYRVDTIKEPAKGRDGKLKLTVAKDRPGNRAKGSTACHIDLLSSDGRLEVNCVHEAIVEGAVFRPTVYMERVSRWLEDHPGASTRAISDGVTGKQDMIKEAIGVLVSEGWVKVEAGQRGAQLHSVDRQFREYNDVPTPVDNHQIDPPAATASHRVPPRPDRVPGRGQSDRVPRPQSLYGDAGTQSDGAGQSTFLEEEQIDRVPDQIDDSETPSGDAVWNPWT